MMFCNLKYCSANIVVLKLGGNNFDMRGITRMREDVVKDIGHLIKELIDLEKVVYFLGIPTRFSKRNHDLDVIQENINYVYRTMRKILNGRFIDLTYESFQRGGFSCNRNGEIVHLFPRVYDAVAEKLLQRMNRDLSLKLTSPEKYVQKVNLRIE